MARAIRCKAKRKTLKSVTPKDNMDLRGLPESSVELPN